MYGNWRFCALFQGFEHVFREGGIIEARAHRILSAPNEDTLPAIALTKEKGRGSLLSPFRYFL